MGPNTHCVNLLINFSVEQPTFTKVLEDIAIRDYAQLELKIRAEGIPKPDITW